MSFYRNSGNCGDVDSGLRSQVYPEMFVQATFDNPTSTSAADPQQQSKKLAKKTAEQ
jgi:hypothetical protein